MDAVQLENFNWNILVEADDGPGLARVNSHLRLRYVTGRVVTMLTRLDAKLILNHG